MNTSPLILKNVSVELDQKKILNGLNVEFSSNKINALLGRSGCGKSTLIKALVQELEISGGDISGVEKPFGYAQQNSPLFPWMSICENLKLANPELTSEEVSTLLEKAGLKDKGELLPKQISFGMRSRVVLLRAFASNSKLVLLDEPFSALDVVTKEAMLTLLLELWNKNKPTLIFVTHDLNEALAIADRILVLSNPGSKIVLDFEVASEKPRFNNLRLQEDIDRIKKALL